MSKTVKHLEELISITQSTIKTIQEGENEKDALKMFNKGLDKNLIKIVKEFGGESYFYKGNNYSAWQLAMGEVE
jgi:hypothetical protein